MLGEKIEELISLNIQIWHKDTLVRNNATISKEKKAELFLAARIPNSKRSSVRDEIDNLLGQRSCSKKINYSGNNKE